MRRTRKDIKGMHKYTFDVWPPDSTEFTLPGVISRWAWNVHDARKMATRDCPRGSFVTNRGHVLSQCHVAGHDANEQILYTS